MKRSYKALFPILLVLACIVVYCWQHAFVNLILPYLPSNEIVYLVVFTFLLFFLTFFATFVLTKQSGASHPFRRSLVSVAGMLFPVVIAGAFVLSYAARRYAGILPVIILPDVPLGVVMIVVTALCALHLTGLLICRFIKQKSKLYVVIPALLGWVVLNGCLFLFTV